MASPRRLHEQRGVISRVISPQSPITSLCACIWPLRGGFVSKGVVRWAGRPHDVGRPCWQRQRACAPRVDVSARDGMWECMHSWLHAGWTRAHRAIHRAIRCCEGAAHAGALREHAITRRGGAGELIRRPKERGVMSGLLRVGVGIHRVAVWRCPAGTPTGRARRHGSGRVCAGGRHPHPPRDRAARDGLPSRAVGSSCGADLWWGVCYTRQCRRRRS